MNWSNNIDINTFHNAYETYKKHFKKLHKPKLSFNKFYKLSLAAQYKMLSIKELKKLNVINLNYDRLQKNINDTYPDKPRGDDDIKSIKYSIENIVSPICILQINPKTLILLDGMHRIVASNLLNSKVSTCIIKANY